jgi:hypothetical protein
MKTRRKIQSTRVTTRKHSDFQKRLMKRRIQLYNGKHNTNIGANFHRIQYGGGLAKNYGIDVWEDDDGESIFIFAGKRRKSNYIMLVFSKDSKEMELHEFSTDKIIPGHILSDEKIADIFTKIVYDICLQKGATRMVLQDNSEIPCNKKKVKLADMYFLAHGISWYQTKFIGLQPDVSLDVYIQNVKQNSWNDIDRYLQEHFPKTHENLQPYIHAIPIKDMDSPGSAMKVFRSMKERKQCEPFSLFMNELLLASKVPSLFGSTWHLDFERRNHI